MAIKIYNNRISFGSYDIVTDDSGIKVEGTFDILHKGNYIRSLTYGYTMGGAIGALAPPANGSMTYNTVDRFPFSSDSNATNVGNIGADSYGGTSNSSETNAYKIGGTGIPPVPGTVFQLLKEAIRFPFASGAASAVSSLQIGNLLVGNDEFVQGISSNTYGYIIGGSQTPTAVGAAISRYPFAVDDSLATQSVGLVPPAPVSPLKNSTSASTFTTGYVMGGINLFPTPTYINTIWKFPFAQESGSIPDTNGDLTVSRHGGTGHSSATHAYSSGGYSAITTLSNVIDKFPFASDANATDVGDLSVNRVLVAGQTSFNHGYISGGFAPPTTAYNTIDKFPFASDANATDVGDLSETKKSVTGAQG